MPKPSSKPLASTAESSSRIHTIPPCMSTPHQARGTTSDNLGIPNFLKGRVAKEALALQLISLSPTIQIPPKLHHKSSGRNGRKNKSQFFTFTLGGWNDRNQVLHGHSIDHSSIFLAEYVHKDVSVEYSRFSRESNEFMDANFRVPLLTKIRGRS